ncbi:MAG: TonB-dependent receptor [Pontiella sp.]
MKYQILLAACTVAAFTSAQTSETNTSNQIIVSATRIETPLEKMGTTVNVITSKDIENSKAATVSDLLRRVPGVSIARNGGPGQSSSIYLRGAKPQHTLVLIDGVRMNSQLGLSGYDMTHLQTLDIDTIEILKGPQSTLYGSDAMAGVISITTKKGSGRPVPYIDIEGGSYGTWRAATGVSGGDDLLDYSASIQRYERLGQSAKNTNDETDGTKNTTFSTRLGTRPTDTTSLDFTLRYIDAFSDYDGFIDPIGYHVADEQLSTRLSGSASVFDDLVESTVGASYVDLYSVNITPLDETPFEAKTYSADWINIIYLPADHTLMAGIDGSRDEYEFRTVNGYLENLGVFGAYQAVLSSSLNANLGIRNDTHSEFGNETTYQASGSYEFQPTGTRLKASWGTGFKAPTSYQLYSAFGDPSLQPENSESVEVGLEQQIITNRLDVGIAVFRNEYSNLIEYDFNTSKYNNIGDGITDGTEVYLSAAILHNLAFRGGYTYLDNDSEDIGFLLRRPTHKVDLDLNYAATRKLNINLNISYSGERNDQDFSTFPATIITHDPYTLVNIAARYQLTKNVQIYGRIDNLLDEDYQTAYTYNQDGIGGYAGIKVTL